MGGIGYAGGNSFEILKKDVNRFEHVAVVGLVLLLAAGTVFWYLKKKRKLREKK
jgi:LPXTG-motif cell wall-anchored protein